MVAVPRITPLYSTKPSTPEGFVINLLIFVVQVSYICTGSMDIFPDGNVISVTEMGCELELLFYGKSGTYVINIISTLSYIPPHLSASTLRSVPARILTCQCFLSSAISVVIRFLAISSVTRSRHISLGANEISASLPHRSATLYPGRPGRVQPRARSCAQHWARVVCVVTR